MTLEIQLMQVKIHVEILASQLLKMSTVGESETETIYQWIKFGVGEQKHSFLDSIKWLTIESGKLVCAICKKFDILVPYMKQGQKMSKEWASSQIALTVDKSGRERSGANLKAIGNKNLQAQAVVSSYCGGVNVKECCRRLHGIA